MKRTAILILAIALASCSTASRVSLTEAPSSPTTEMGTPTQQFGNVQVILDAKGNWSRLSATASASLLSEEPKHIDDALRRARAAAYQSIAKFLDVHVSTKTINKSVNADDVITHSGSDITTEKAAALLKGVTFDQQYAEGDRVYVRAIATPQSSNAASQIRATMLRGLERK